MDQQVVDQTFLPTATFPAALVNQMENIFSRRVYELNAPARSPDGFVCSQSHVFR